MTRKVLIVEDDPDIAQLVKLHLRDIDCEAEIATDGIEGLSAFQRGQFGLVVLDVMLPGMDGLAVCRQLREEAGYVPILMLTAKSSELDRVVGLEMGADDYLTKPFSVLEFQARIKALFRRTDAQKSQAESTQQTEVITRGPLVIDINRHQVHIRQQPVELTAREFDLLLHFARHPGAVYNRTQLLDAVWGYHHEGYEHTVNTHINRLRRKIEQDVANPEFILTVWGVGYKFSDTC